VFSSFKYVIRLARLPTHNAISHNFFPAVSNVCQQAMSCRSIIQKICELGSRGFITFLTRCCLWPYSEAQGPVCVRERIESCLPTF